MRPRVIPAEVGLLFGIHGPALSRFNEAAGYPRGSRLAEAKDETALAAASMRPRVIPAEVKVQSINRATGEQLQ